MNLGEELAHRVSCVQQQTPDGYGEPLSLRNHLSAVQNRINELEKSETVFKQYLETHGEDEVVQSLLEELDTLRTLAKKAAEVLSAP